jgi:hypothetical protein
MGKGKWESEMERVVKISQDAKKLGDDSMQKYQQAFDAAQGFMSGHAKSAPKLTKALSEMMDAEEECARAAGELSVYEEEYEAAKKAKDKDQMKQLENKMKPLIQTFETNKKEHNTVLAEFQKNRQELDGLLATVHSATG